MGTNIRPELSKKNMYYIPKHRYYELLHFCRQYNDFKEKRIQIINSLIASRAYDEQHSSKLEYSNFTEKAGIELHAIGLKMDMIMDCCKMADKGLKDYIFMAVTTGKSYESMRAKYNIPCGKNQFYEVYRKFFWLLDKRRI